PAHDPQEAAASLCLDPGRAICSYTTARVGCVISADDTSELFRTDFLLPGAARSIVKFGYALPTYREWQAQ
ncbi:hypothetical protein AB9X41_10495, partial [Ralstonia solanacearum]|uniref:hypothetical protein n=1 Tax=Ralstonia solanacearum TaxID=305 RepID=UPI00351996C2